MSNHITLEPTKFTSLRSIDPDTQKPIETFGFRIYDDYEKHYDNLMDEEKIPDDDLDFLDEVVSECEGEVKQMLREVRHAEQGIFIGGEWYEWEKIKDSLEEL